MSKSKFMIHLQGAVYANELYAFPSMNGKHIYKLEQAVERAKHLFSDCKWTVYNGNESYSNFGLDT